jgi:hypothetical protein
MIKKSQCIHDQNQSTMLSFILYKSSRISPLFDMNSLSSFGTFICLNILLYSLYFLQKSADIFIDRFSIADLTLYLSSELF